jgi:quinol monooxygenase YgiN
MATILAHITVKPGSAARFERIAAELHRSTHEHEPNVRRYEYWRGADADHYYTLLSFDSFEDFIAHQTSPHHEAASRELGEVIASIRLEWVDPIVDSSPLVATESADLSGHPDALIRKYADRYAAQVAPWWQAVRSPL